MLKKIKFILLIAAMAAISGRTMATPSDSPILPSNMKALMGRGFDVSWAEFGKNIAGYSVKEVKAHNAMGFKNARIRTALAADATLFGYLDKCVTDCLNNGLIPIIAHNASAYEADPTDANLVADSLWWATVADHFKNTSHKLVFNINIEWSDVAGKDPTVVNNYYKRIVPGIRATNPTRILIFSPIKLSSPEYLSQLVIPASAGSYVMAEWHLYAAGPSSDPTSPRYWTTGTAAQKKVITDEINIGAAWEKSSGIATWVGAWMAGDYNKGNTFSAARQAEFASFMVSEFARVGVPWSINASDNYYDYTNNVWIDSMKVVLNVLSPLTNPLSETATIEAATSIRIAGNTLVIDDAVPTMVDMYNCDGKLMSHQEVTSSRYTLPNEPTGVYLVVATRNGKTVFSEKVIRTQTGC